MLRDAFRFQMHSTYSSSISKKALGDFSMNFVMMAIGIHLALGSILPYCYYASRISHTVGLNAAHAYSSNWYLFTIDQQRCLQMILTHAQVKRNFTGYGIIDCSMEVFLMVCTIWSLVGKTNKMRLASFVLICIFLDCKRSGLICYHLEKILRLNRATSIVSYHYIVTVNFIYCITYYLFVGVTKTGNSRNLLRTKKQSLQGKQGKYRNYSCT